MLRKLFATFGLLASATSAIATPPYAPYKSEAANATYNLLFCDDVAAFAAKPGEKATEWQLALTSKPPNIPALEALAADLAQEGRIRYLAYKQLRDAGHSVIAKQLLGVVVEMPLSGGLDTLAAYSDGGVRYVNQSGKLVAIEGVASFRPLVEDLFAASQPVVSKIGPWDKPRRPPPASGSLRLTFLVSDGLYFGEGPLSTMQREQLAGPIIKNATVLLQAVVATSTK